MQLRHIKDEVCHTCGAEVVSETRETREHVNGDRWETRQFACGCKLEYIPNYRKFQISRPCDNDPELVAKRAARDAAADKITAFVNKLDVDDEYKKAVLKELDRSYLYTNG